MDNNHGKLFVIKQSKGCKFMPKMHQNTTTHLCEVVEGTTTYLCEVVESTLLHTCARWWRVDYYT